MDRRETRTQSAHGLVMAHDEKLTIGRKLAGEGGDEADPVIAVRHQDQRRWLDGGEGTRGGAGRLHGRRRKAETRERHGLQREGEGDAGGGRPAWEGADRCGQQQRRPGRGEAEIAELDRAGVEDAAEQQEADRRGEGEGGEEAA